MKIKSALALLSVVALTGCSSNSSQKGPTLVDDSELLKHDELAETFENSIVLPSTGQGEANQAADPFVLRYNGYYYMYPTTSGRYIRGYKSKDLVNWERVKAKGLGEGYVYSYAGDPKAPKAETPFAPEVIYYNGYFYLICSPSGQGHYVLRSESPEGPFKSITDNIEKSIDGSYFVDNDFQVYLTTAGSGALKLYKMEDDFVSVKDNYEISLTNCKVGNWNEGGYMLKKDGNYYYTYCGSHYLSSNYRVDYSVVMEGDDVSKPSSYISKGNVLLSTDNVDFRGLGHSATVLGPDLDSYYIVYHNLNKTNQRFFDLSRLSFNGSRMVANDVRLKENFMPTEASFASYEGENMVDVGSLTLSETKHEDTFTVEFNTTGLGKQIFSYEDDKNYGYVQFSENLNLGIYKVKNGSTSLVKEIPLMEDLNIEANHTIRLSYKDELMDVYFDTIELVNDLKCTFNGGKVGHDNNFDEVGFIGFSNYGQGSSDKAVYNSSKVLANAYDDRLSYLNEGSGLVEAKEGDYLDAYANNLILKNKDDRATYRLYVEDDLTKNLNIRIPGAYRNKKIGLRIDDKEIKTLTLTSEATDFAKGDINLNLATLDLDMGQHYISFYNVGDEVGFSSFDLVKKDEETETNCDLNSSLSDKRYVDIGRVDLSKGYLESDYQYGYGLVLNHNYSNNYEASAEVSYSDGGGYVGLLFNVNNFSENFSGDADRGDNPNSFKGYRLQIEKTGIALYQVDFNTQELLNFSQFNVEPDKKYTLKVTQSDKTITCFIDDEVLFEVTPNIGELGGKIGVMTSDVKAKAFNIKGKY